MLLCWGEVFSERSGRDDFVGMADGQWSSVIETETGYSRKNQPTNGKGEPLAIFCWYMRGNY